MNSTKDDLTNGQIYHLKYSYESLFETASDTEEFLIRNKYIRKMGRISKKALEELVLYTPYKKVVNDRESAIIGVDLMKQISLDNTAIWIESSNVSSKIESYNKFNSFLTTRYSDRVTPCAIGSLYGYAHLGAHTSIMTYHTRKSKI